jgi:hypothetical protein
MDLPPPDRTATDRRRPGCARGADGAGEPALGLHPLPLPEPEPLPDLRWLKTVVVSDEERAPSQSW